MQELLAYYFINQSPQDLETEMELRQVVAKLPELARLGIYAAFSTSRPSFEPTTFAITDGMVLANQCCRSIAFPSPVSLVVLSHIVFGYEELLRRKYCLPEFVEVEPGDVVVDCGAYVGGFSQSASKVARQVHAFEPDTLNFRCLSHNLKDQPNVRLNMEGLYSESKTMTLNVSASGVEHSLLMPDDGDPITTRDISVRCLWDYCRQTGIDTIDFCKIEAEGVELEVFEGLRDMRPRKFAIDVSPERNGESPAEEFRKRLKALGYEVRQRGNVLFARLRSSADEQTVKVIYSLWMQGRENAPSIVQYNFSRWEKMNPTYSLRVLDAKDVQRLVEGLNFDTSSLSVQSLSDIVRLRLLKDRGGIWVDASVLPILPLDEWLRNVMDLNRFFAFEREDVPLSSWFLWALPDSIVIQRWWNEVERLWSSPHHVSSKPVIPPNPAERVSPQFLEGSEEIPYFWVHCLLQYVLEQDPEVSDIWQRRTRISAMPCHDLQNLFTVNGQPTDRQIQESAFNAPVQKLDWRVSYPVDRIETLLAKGKPVGKKSVYRLVRRRLGAIRARLISRLSVS